MGTQLTAHATSSTESADSRRILSRAFLRDAVVVCFFQTLLWLGIRGTGFRAISDDDYARVVIARELFSSPLYDPSGTSWLPFPFWLSGLFTALPFPGLEAARAAALFSSLLGSVLLLAAGANLGLKPRWSLFGTIACLSIPYAAYLSAATVPEHLNAALLVFAASTLARSDSRFALWGALACACACASRYESWPATLGFAMFQLLQRGDARSKRPWLPISISLLFPALWMLHGWLNHGNALFFVRRVAEYKAALGDSLPGARELIHGYPRALILAEPETATLLVLSALAAWFVTPLSGGARKVRLDRAWIPSCLLLVSLLIGAARGGAPTHHSERALLSLWFLAVLTSSWLLQRLHAQRRLLPPVVGVAALAAGGVCRQAQLFERSGFADRREEERIGRHLSSLSDPGQTVGLLTADYGYFAIQAAAEGVPTTVLRTHDPRNRTADSDPLEEFLKRDCLVVLPSEGPRAECSTKANDCGLRVSVSKPVICEKFGVRPQTDLNSGVHVHHRKTPAFLSHPFFRRYGISCRPDFRQDGVRTHSRLLRVRRGATSRGKAGSDARDV